jgi:hypothetical protein
MYAHLLDYAQTALGVVAVGIAVWFALWHRELMRGFRWTWGVLAAEYCLAFFSFRHADAQGQLPADMIQLTQPWHLALCILLMAVYAFGLCLVLWLVGYPIQLFRRRRKVQHAAELPT